MIRRVPRRTAMGGHQARPHPYSCMPLQSRQAANLLSRIFLDTFCYLCGTASVSLWACPSAPDGQATPCLLVLKIVPSHTGPGDFPLCVSNEQKEPPFAQTMGPICNGPTFLAMIGTKKPAPCDAHSA